MIFKKSVEKLRFFGAHVNKSGVIGGGRVIVIIGFEQRGVLHGGA
jgi:hypothetical protein